MRRISTFLSRLWTTVPAAREPRPYSKEWIIEDLAARLAASEARERELGARLLAVTERAADAVVAQHGVEPIFAPPAPPPGEAESGVASIEDKRQQMRQQRELDRHRFAELIGKTYEDVLHREQAGMFNDPKWDIHNPGWWMSIGARLEDEKAKGAANVSARA